MVVTKELAAPKVEGKHWRLLCMTGQDKGKSYYLKDKRIVLGRGETADIQVLDTKSSREHAELKLIGDTYVLTDLGSQNGIVINELKVSQHTLIDGDRIIIGSTVYKYSFYNIEKPKLAIVKDDKKKDDDAFTATPTQPAKRTSSVKILLILLILGGVFLLFDDESGKSGKQKRTLKELNENMASNIRQQMSEEEKQVKGKLEVIIHRGLRELREGNYFRAIAEFNLALVLSPNNGRASFYLNKAKQALDTEVETNFLKAKQDADALKYKNAVTSYCSIVRLLDGYPEDQRYKDAETNIRTLEEKMGIEKGETKCKEGPSRIIEE